MTVYVESSALVKLVVEEAESAAVADALAGYASQASSVVAAVEVPRAVARAAPAAPTAGAVAAVLGQLGLLALDRGVRERAAQLEAIHLATALALGEALEALVTYDARLAEAAGAAGVTALTPG